MMELRHCQSPPEGSFEDKIACFSAGIMDYIPFQAYAYPASSLGVMEK